MCSSPASKITIFGATLCLNKGLPVKTLQRTKAIHEHLEDWMRLTDAKPQVSSLQNPEHILNKWALVGCLHSNLIKFVNAQTDRFAEWPLEGEEITMQPVIRAQVRGDQEKRRSKKLKKPPAQSCI